MCGRTQTINCYYEIQKGSNGVFYRYKYRTLLISFLSRLVRAGSGVVYRTMGCEKETDPTLEGTRGVVSYW